MAENGPGTLASGASVPGLFYKAGILAGAPRLEFSVAALVPVDHRGLVTVATFGWAPFPLTGAALPTVVSVLFQRSASAPARKRPPGHAALDSQLEPSGFLAQSLG